MKDRMRRIRLIQSARASGSAGTTGVERRTKDLVAPEVQALLDHARIIAPLPRDVRTRALARARAVLAAAARPGKGGPAAQVLAIERTGSGTGSAQGRAASPDPEPGSRGPRRDERGPRDLVQKRVRRG